MSNFLVCDFDDFGVDAKLSDQCQTRDCRIELLELRAVNPLFKVTLFAVPALMTGELLKWAKDNESWVELGVHGWSHSSNYECEDWGYGIMDKYMETGFIWEYFNTLFKAPGWQISDGCYKWLKDHKWMLADQEYNDDRRPKDIPTYKVNDNSVHGHTWDCMGNGIQETLEQLKERIKDVQEFRFVSEACQ